TAISRLPTAPADCSAFATPPRPQFWSVCDDTSEKISRTADQSRNQSVLGCGRARQVPDQALHRLWGSALLSAFDLPVLLFRQDGVGRSLRRGHDLHLQPDAEIPD